MMVCAICFLFGTRSKFFYFLSMLTLDKVIISYFKLAYAEPRPYMISSDITPVTCSKAFGQPSGHSSASLLVSIVLFMDTFHGRTNPYYRPKVYSNYAYFGALFVAIYWPLTIPFTRYLMGAHSLD